MEVYVKVSYGKPKIYPACANAQKFIDELGVKTFSHKQANALMNNGIEFKQVPCPELEMTLSEALQLMSEIKPKRASKKEKIDSVKPLSGSTNFMSNFKPASNEDGQWPLLGNVSFIDQLERNYEGANKVIKEAIAKDYGITVDKLVQYYGRYQSTKSHQ